jgi:hypothetical protein
VQDGQADSEATAMATATPPTEELADLAEVVQAEEGSTPRKTADPDGRDEGLLE